MSLSHPGGEALIVHLDGDLLPEAGGEPAGELARLARLLGLAAVERQGQADQDQLGLALLGQPPQPASPRLVPGR